MVSFVLVMETVPLKFGEVLRPLPLKVAEGVVMVYVPGASV
jgi:hypothetical protein